MRSDWSSWGNDQQTKAIWEAGNVQITEANGSERWIQKMMHNTEYKKDIITSRGLREKGNSYE